MTVHKWHVLRLALGFAFRFPDLHVDMMRDDGRGAEYDLRQVTGLGKKPDEDITGAVTAMLKHLRNEGQERSLEAEVCRGLALIRRMWREDESLWTFLERSVVPDIHQVAPAMEPSHVASAVAQFGLRVDANIAQGARMTVFTLSDPRGAVGPGVVDIREAIAERYAQPDLLIDLTPVAGDSGRLELAIERSPLTWVPVSRIVASGPYGVTIGTDPSGRPVAISGGRVSVVIAERLRLPSMFARMLAAEPGKRVVVVASHESSLWDEVDLPPGLEVYLPEDSRLLSDRGRGADHILFDAPSADVRGWRQATSLWMLMREDPNIRSVGSSDAILWVGRQPRDSLEFRGHGIDLRHVRSGDALMWFAKGARIEYSRVHLPYPWGQS